VKYRDGRAHRRVPEAVHAGRYATIPDPLGPVDVRLVDGILVRSLYKTDYTEGGHHYVYRWVPKPEIWVERDIDPAELPFVVAHEYTERRLMRDEGLDYDKAHANCSKVEFALREGDSLRDLVAPRGRPFTRSDLPRLASDDYYRSVLRRYRRR
jgi:hypothetical protein